MSKAPGRVCSGLHGEEESRRRRILEKKNPGEEESIGDYDVYRNSTCQFVGLVYRVITPFHAVHWRNLLASMSSRSSPVTKLLHAARSGDSEALDRLIPIVYDELRGLAHVVRQDRSNATIDTTGLVHEAYEKLVPSDVDWKDRTHFFRVAARAMRQVLVDAARKRRAEKRGGSNTDITFDDNLYEHPVNDEELIALDDALDRLFQMDARQARIVECRFFAGLTVEETALALGISTPTVYRDWRAARAWLATQLAA